MSHAEQRKLKINWLLHYIEACCNKGKSVSKDKLLGEFCIEWGAGRRYAEDYFRDLISARKIIIDGDEIFTPELFKEIKDVK